MLVHSGGDGPRRVLWRSRARRRRRPTGRPAGRLPAPAPRATDGSAAYVVPAMDTPEHGRRRRPRRVRPHAVPVFGGAAVDFGPDGDELAFIAPAKAGPAGHPPDRAAPRRRRRSGASGPSAGHVVAFFWSPNGRTIAALQIGTPRRQRSALARSTPAAPARGRAGLALDLVFVDVACGAIRARRRPGWPTLRGAGAPLLRPVRAEPSALVAGQRASIALPLVADDADDRSWSIIRPDGSGARRDRRRGRRLLEPLNSCPVQSTYAHYLCIASVHARLRP